MKKIIFFVFFLLAVALNAPKVAQVPYYSDFEVTSWRVEYGLHGFTPGTGSFHTYSIHSCTLANLSSSTTYDIYIQPVCADTLFVFYSGPVAVYTDVCEQPDISLFAESSYSDALCPAPVVAYAPCSVSTMLLDSATLGGPRDYERLRFFYFC